MPVKTPVLTDAAAQVVDSYNANIDANFNVADRISWAFAPHEQDMPNMTVRLEAGYIPAVGSLPTEVDSQSTETISAPGTNPRRDIVYVDATDGTVGVAGGMEAADPVDPDIPDGKIAVARINLTTSHTNITNADLDDLRSPPIATSSGGSAGTLPRGYIDGLILANNATDSDHDIDIATGAARDGANSDDIELTASLTKQIDATWAAGTNQGGLDTGTVAADTTYHVFAIKNSTTDVVDVLFSTSVSSPTLPTGYYKKRRIGAVITDGSANIVQFLQDGDWFWKDEPGNDSNSAWTTTAATVALKVPTGLRLNVWCTATTRRNDSTSCGDVRGADLSISVGDIDLPNKIIAGGGALGASEIKAVGSFWAITDTSAQVKAIAGNFNQNGSFISSKAWIDPRGKNQ